MDVARFLIQAAHEKEKQVKQFSQYAGVYFSVKDDGRPVDVKPATVNVDGVAIHMSLNHHHQVGPAGLFLAGFDFIFAQNSDQNEYLMSLKPKLEAAFTKLGDALTPGDDVVGGKKDLRTGEMLPTNRNVVYEYRFYDPKFETVTETIKHPTRIFFSCAVPMPEGKKVVGRVGNLQVIWSRCLREGWRDDTLYFKWPGWIEKGVDEMRVRFSDGEITAAFQALVEKMLTADLTPKEASRWRATKATKIELVKE